ncbi:MAG TPA: hypothetical protein VM070_05990 [Candidatus Saccharimonadales bacterium]|nr:hypothetical protein [Candidatus Saccharimonadales bacterium]
MMDERLAALGLAPRLAPAAPLPPVVAARPDALLSRAVLVREGRRQAAGLLQIGPAGIRLTVGGIPRTVGWSGISAARAARGEVVIETPHQRWSLALSVDGIAEPALAPFLAAILAEGLRGGVDPVGGALHELANASDRVIDTFGDADDPIVPLAVGSFTLLAAALLTVMLPVAAEIIARRGVAPGSFAIDPRISALDPRALVAATAIAAALASWSARYALGEAAAAWARGTLRDWHRTTNAAERLLRRLLARTLLTPGRIAAVGLVALLLLIPSAAARTTIDANGIHQRFGLPLLAVDRSWREVVEVVPVAVGIGERAEGFATTFVLIDGTRVSTRGHDLTGGAERQLFERARSWAGGDRPR